MFVVDTNVLVYAADADAPEHARRRTQLEAWRTRAAAWYLTWGICYEFLCVVTHPNVFRKPWSADQAWRFLSAVLQSTGISLLVPGDRHSRNLEDILREVPLASGNLFHDLETVTLMREHGVRVICTRDTDLHRFRFVEPADPMVADL